MKRSLISSASWALSSLTSAHAAYYEPTSTIHAVGTSAPDLWGEYEYLLLAGFTSAGNCALESETGLVVVRLSHAKAYAAALAAQASGKLVKVSLDDTRRDSYGQCILRWLKVLD